MDAEHLLGTGLRDEHAVPPFTALAPLALRLVLAHVVLGIAEGALAEARDARGTAPPAQPPAPPSTPSHGNGCAECCCAGTEQGLLVAYGEMVTAARAADALLERAGGALERGVLAGGELGADERADIAVLVATAESVAERAALHITAGVLTAAGGPGLDRFRRNVHTLTAQRPATGGLRDVGDHYLNGAHPPAAGRPGPYGPPDAYRGRWYGNAGRPAGRPAGRIGAGPAGQPLCPADGSGPP